MPFSRAGDDQVRSVQGSGLGMSIAHKLVSAMGGNIQVESELGRGSRFTVTLNLRIDQDARAEQPSPGNRGEAPPRRMTTSPPEPACCWLRTMI